MKSKIFRGEGNAAIIRAVNEWLAGENGIVIRDTETGPAVTDPVTGRSEMSFRIWYEQAAG